MRKRTSRNLPRRKMVLDRECVVEARWWRLPYWGFSRSWSSRGGADGVRRFFPPHPTMVAHLPHHYLSHIHTYCISDASQDACTTSCPWLRTTQCEEMWDVHEMRNWTSEECGRGVVRDHDPGEVRSARGGAAESRYRRGGRGLVLYWKIGQSYWKKCARRNLYIMI